MIFPSLNVVPGGQGKGTLAHSTDICTAAQCLIHILWISKKPSVSRAVKLACFRDTNSTPKIKKKKSIETRIPDPIPFSLCFAIDFYAVTYGVLI